MKGAPNPTEPMLCFSCEEEVWFVYRVLCTNCTVEQRREVVHLICTGCKADLRDAKLIEETIYLGSSLHPQWRARSEGCPTLELLMAMRLMR